MNNNHHLALNCAGIIRIDCPDLIGHQFENAVSVLFQHMFVNYAENEKALKKFLKSKQGVHRQNNCVRHTRE